MSSSPTVPVLVYDGNCGFCSSSARWIAASWSEPAQVRAYQMLGDDGLLLLGLTASEAAAAAWWIDAHGQRWRGHDAVAHALMQSSGWRRLAGQVIASRLMRLPAAAGYALVSRYRRFLPGDASCGAPD